VAINDVLPLKAARHDAIANLKCFWGLRHQRLNFDNYIYIHYAAPPYWARISDIYFFSFGNVWLGSVSVRKRNAWQKNLRRVGENSGPILSRLCTKIHKVHEIFRRCRKFLVLSNAFSDCLRHVSLRSYSPLSLKSSKNRANVKVFWPQFLGGTALTFLRQFVCAIYYPLLGKVWLN